ncbi:hypothetical protein DQE82_19205 [Micromonospora sp. LHW51205]|nr:hypothetical protein DQE82_19205 [Micromonospora sp. LHW51205]
MVMIRPRTPAAMRIQPTTSRSTPPTLALSANVRIAPTAIRKMLVPIPTTASFGGMVVLSPASVPRR